MRRFINDKYVIKSIVIENTDRNLYLNLVYGDTIKITPRRFDLTSHHPKFFNKLKERYSLCGIDGCACKPKKIRVLADDFERLKYTIGELEGISHAIDVKLGIYIYFEYYYRYFSIYDTIVFNHSNRLMSDKDTYLIFTGNTLAAVHDGNYYNFRIDERAEELKHSYIKGKI